MVIFVKRTLFCHECQCIYKVYFAVILVFFYYSLSKYYRTCSMFNLIRKDLSNVGETWSSNVFYWCLTGKELEIFLCPGNRSVACDFFILFLLLWNWKVIYFIFWQPQTGQQFFRSILKMLWYECYTFICQRCVNYCGF